MPKRNDPIPGYIYVQLTLKEAAVSHMLLREVLDKFKTQGDWEIKGNPTQEEWEKKYTQPKLVQRTILQLEEALKKAGATFDKVERKWVV